MTPIFIGSAPQAGKPTATTNVRAKKTVHKTLDLFMTLSSLRKRLVADSARQEFEKCGKRSAVPRELPLDLLLPLAALLSLDQLHASDFLAKDLTSCALGKIVREFHVIWGLILHRVGFAVSDHLIACGLHSRLQDNKSPDPLAGVYVRNAHDTGLEDLQVRKQDFLHISRIDFESARNNHVSLIDPVRKPPPASQLLRGKVSRISLNEPAGRVT
jgi:hypothetical protein